MKSRSAKNKGKRLQNNVRDLLLESFNQLEPDDIKSAIMGESGEDIKLSPAARRLIPYSLECKNQEALNIWSSLEQAETNSGDYDPVLIFKRNRTKTYAVLEFDKLLELLDESRSEEHTSELQSRLHLVCRLLLEKKKHKPSPQFHARSA